MRKIFLEELNRAVHSPRGWLALFFASAFLIYGISKAYFSEWVPQGFSFADLWYFVYLASYFPYVLPLLAALPFSDSFVIDHSEGYLRYLVVRSKYRHYLAAKFLVNGLMGALMILIPLLCLYIFTNLTAPRGIYPVNTWQPNISGRPYGILLPFFQAHPDVFILLISLLAALSGAVYSNLGLSISLFFPNRYLAWGAPTLIYLVSDFITQRTHFFGPDWSPILSIAGSVNLSNETVRSFILNPLGVLSLTIFITLLFGKRKRILQ